MKGFLLDTNVISEIVKPEPDPQVITFLGSQSELWLSTIVVHEIEFGLQLLPRGDRRTSLGIALAVLVDEYRDFVLPVDRPEAEHAATLRVVARRSGRVLRLADALIAGTAKAHDLCLATRNARDFDGLDIDVANPWDASDLFAPLQVAQQQV